MQFRVTHREPLVKTAKAQRYCGPAALSALSGYSAECMAAWINYRRDVPLYYQTGGVSSYEAEYAASKVGICMVEEGPFREWTVNQLRKALAGGGSHQRLWSQPLLVTAHHHYFAVYCGMVVDSGACAGSEPIPIREYKKGRAKVTRVQRVVRQGKLKKREPMPWDVSLRTKAQMLKPERQTW